MNPMNAWRMITTIIEALGNRLLSLDPETRDQLSQLQGKKLCVRILDTDGNTLFPVWIILLTENGWRLLKDNKEEVDVTLSGSLPVFARLLLKDWFKQGPTPGELKISGDIELGQKCQQLFQDLDIDWEEQAARYIGDVPAHQLGNLVRDLLRWQSRSFGILGEDVAEYLQEESMILVKREQVEDFLRGVDEVRSDIDRIEQRVRRLGSLL